MTTATLLRRLLWATLLACLAQAAQAQPAAETDLLADKTAWTLAQPGSAAWSGSRVQLPSMANPNDTAQTVTRPLRLGPAAAWTLVARLSAVQPLQTDAALGLVLQSPDGRTLYVMLRPQERDAVIVRSQGAEWREPLTALVPVPGWQGSATTPHELAVASSGGRLQVQVDGKPVLQTGVIDFEPSAVGLRATRTQATVDSLVLRETGRDARLARLAGLASAPGSAQLFDDDMAAGGVAERARAAGRSLLGSIGGLFGSGGASSTAATAPAGGGWGDAWNNANTAFSRDAERKRLVLESRTKDFRAWLTPDAGQPLPFAAVAAQMRLESLQLTGEGSGSLMLRDSRTRPPQGEDPSMLMVTLAADGMTLWQYRQSDKLWQRHGLVPAQANGGVPKSGLLRLVAQGRSAWLFADGRLLLHATGLAPMQPNEAGLYVDNVARMEVSRFSFGEL